MQSNIPTEEGRELGEDMARVVTYFMQKHGIEDKRCDTCAFRRGTMANGSLGTLANAIKAAIEKDVFRCHEGDKPPCHGWLIMRQHTARLREFGYTVPWEYIEGRDNIKDGDVILLPDQSGLYL